MTHLNQPLRINALLSSLMACLLTLSSACSEDDTGEEELTSPESGASTDCDDTVIAGLLPHSHLATVECSENYLHIHSETGLADPTPVAANERMMVGITAWILRVPAPYDYQWLIPRNPQWQDTLTEASPRGPIAVAVNGVPIFHYEARPDVATHIEHYDAGSDTVVQGELDHCGGHAGQGDDYHYHYAPVCLLENHDFSAPIAFGLDGAPVFFGTGGTDYYGNGLYNDLNYLPEAELDDCNALPDGDGGYVHYTTSTPPYLIGCHHGYVDSALQIEPRPMRPQGEEGPYGGQIGEPTATLVTDFILGDDGWYQLEHQSFSGDGTSGVRFQPSDTGCYDFEFREDISTAGEFFTYCRAD